MAVGRKRFVLGGLGLVWLLSAGVYGVRLNRSPGPVVPIRELVRTDDEAPPSTWDGKIVVVEGHWVSHVDGLSVSSFAGSWRDRDPSLLMRPSAGAMKRGFSLRSILPASMQEEPVWLSTGDRVRITGVYRAKGWRPGSILESCEWLQFSEVEKWDPGRGEWRKADGW